MRVYMAATSCLRKQPELMEICDYFLESFISIEDWQMPYFKKAKGFLLDSGAFTFMNGGTHKNLKKYAEKYANFVKDNDIRDFFELDVESIVGWDEYLRINDMIDNITQRKSIPVFHKNRGFEWFENTCKQVDYISFGGVAVARGGQKKKIIDVMPIFINTAHKYNTRIHGLGFTATTMLDKIPFDSVDSSSWTMGQRMGLLYRFTGNNIKYYRPQSHGKRMKNADDVARHNFVEWIKYQRYAEACL